MAFLSFIVTIGILVVVHEFGHYIVARMFKVKILTFSIGFGPKLLKIKGKYNDWVISAIPLGGYVKMLDEREMVVKPEFKSMTFNGKPPLQKILIAFAGPLFNILFAVLIYYVVALIGVSELKPVVTSVDNSRKLLIAEDLKPNMLINSINGIPVVSWNGLDKTFHSLVKKQDVITFAVDGKSNPISINLKKERSNFNNNLYLEDLGLFPYKYLPKVAYIEQNSVAYKAKLKVGDEITVVNDVTNPSWFTVVAVIRNSANKLVNLTIKRDGKDILIKLLPELETSDGSIYGKVGIMPTLDQQLLERNTIEYKYGIAEGIGYAVKSCYNIIGINLFALKGIITGKISASNLAGPISIAKASKTALGDGFKRFADFLALISLGLAVMNLLPIPLLDGGHIVIYVVELFTGKEVSHNIQLFVFKIGFLLVLGVSIFAIYNDMLRL